MSIWLLIAVRIVANPLSNASQKLLAGHGASPLAVVCATHLLLSLVCLPLVVAFPPPISIDFWLNMVLAALLAVAGNSLVVQALALSDLSLLGPINAYKSVVGLLFAIPLLGEMPGLLAVGGVGLIVAGNHLLVRRESGEGSSNWRRFLRDRGVHCRFAALVFSAIEAIFLKKAWQLSAALPTFTVWAIGGLLVSAALALAPLGWGKMRIDLRICRSQPLLLLALAATTGLMQISTVVVLGELPVGYALALFQTSALVSVLVGHRLFAEPNLRQRLIGSFVMVVGAALVVTEGQSSPAGNKPDPAEQSEHAGTSTYSIANEARPLQTHVFHDTSSMRGQTA